MIACFGEVLVDCLPDKNLIGGAPFNVAINLTRLGREVRFISQIGNDEFGKSIYTLAQKEQINTSVSVSEQLETGYVSVNFTNNEPQYTIQENTAWNYIQYKTLDSYPSHFIFGSLATYFQPNLKTFKKYKNLFPQALFVCDLNIRKPFITDDHIIFCLENADFLKINEEELSELYRIFSFTDENQLFHYLLQTFNVKYLLITLGSQGAIFISSSQKLKQSSSPISPSDFKDTIGAGDGFLSAFLHYWIDSSKPQYALEKALAYASKICQNEGAILPNQDLIA